MGARFDVQPLEHAVEIVGGAGVVVIDEHLGVPRRYLDAQSGAIDVAVSVAESGVRIPVERSIEISVVEREIVGVEGSVVKGPVKARPAGEH